MKSRPLNPAWVRQRILAWYQRHKRDLPWRTTRDPYRIWISEIMLQQTRVAAVIPYYERFLERFPDAAALAAAPEQQLLAMWAGLGYYSRARNLQVAAKTILERGGFPRDHASIRELRGVGDYTAAAVASIAFGLPHAVLDGNVVRVLSRLTGEAGDVRTGIVRKRLVAAADRLLDPLHPGEFNQGLMELGATVCLPKQPQCLLCPLNEACEAKLQGKQSEWPMKGAPPEKLAAEKQILVIEKDGRILMWQRSNDSKRLAGFWELPEREQLPSARIHGVSGKFRHTIVNTTYQVNVARAAVRGTPRGFYWLPTNNLHEVALSTTAKKALVCLAIYRGGVKP